jgi:hypothetical protein
MGAFPHKPDPRARLSPRQLQRRAFLAKWSKVDWSKQNCELADEIGLRRERIRQIRKQLGAPESTHSNQRRKSGTGLQWARDNLEKLKGLSAAELGRRYGLGSRWRGGPLYPFLKPFLRDGRGIRKHRWDLMDFRIPDRNLERIWRLPYGLARAYRWRKQRPPPKWCFKPGSGHRRFSGRVQLQANHRAVKAEEQNAARYFVHVSRCGAGVKAA